MNDARALQKPIRRPALLAILDGVGIAPDSSTNAFSSANARYLHELFSGRTWPCVPLSASGLDVGLPAGQMGNSEVGHLNIGAGRVVDQELNRIDNSIASGQMFANPVALDCFDHCADSGSTVHFMGLLSNGGVHSQIAHLEALLKMAADRGVKRMRVAAFLDGRDVLPSSGIEFVRRCRDYCVSLERLYSGLDLRIGMISGRYYAMDRDNRWQRVQLAWQALVPPQTDLALAPANEEVTVYAADYDPVKIVSDSYEAGITDEFVKPVALGSDGVCDGDAVVFFNFRPDRARELTRAFIDPDFSGFARTYRPHVNYVCMTEYDATFAGDMGAQVMFPKSFPKNVLADYLSAQGLRQLHIAETEKYAHVTFFLNGGVEAPKVGEQRILISSPKVSTYDLEPAMSAAKVADALVEAIKNDVADVYIVNFANGDMVGHTGNLEAAIQAVETLDKCVAQVVEAVLAQGGFAIVSADHGNCEQMQDELGNVWTAHTANDVPMAIVGWSDDEFALDFGAKARLCDIAPTLIDAMGLALPKEWTGRSLLVHK